MVSFYKADFLNLTVCGIAMYTLALADVRNKTRDLTNFRSIIFGTAVSITYDIAWFFMRHSELSADKDGEGSVEASVKQFSLYTAYAALFFKFIMIFVFWKLSVKFADFYDHRTEMERGFNRMAPGSRM